MFEGSSFIFQVILSRKATFIISETRVKEKGNKKRYLRNKFRRRTFQKNDHLQRNPRDSEADEERIHDVVQSFSTRCR